jgi:Zn-dependent protease with chaperone function
LQADKIAAAIVYSKNKFNFAPQKINH